MNENTQNKAYNRLGAANGFVPFLPRTTTTLLLPRFFAMFENTTFEEVSCENSQILLDSRKVYCRKQVLFRVLLGNIQRNF